MEAMVRDSELSARYIISIQNCFDALGKLSNDGKESWPLLRGIIFSTASETVGFSLSQKRSWLSTDTLAIIDMKRQARLQGNIAERRRLRRKGLSVEG